MSRAATVYAHVRHLPAGESSPPKVRELFKKEVSPKEEVDGAESPICSLTCSEPECGSQRERPRACASAFPVRPRVQQLPGARVTAASKVSLVGVSHF